MSLLARMPKRGARESVHQLVAHDAREGIEFLRAVERHGGDALRNVVADVLVGHAGPFS
jgi:hypothetical protein